MELNNIIEAKNLVKMYQNTYALDNVSLNIQKGDIYGLVGENGAGKTTLLRAIAKLIFPKSGILEVKENMVMTSLIEVPSLYLNRTAYDNLYYQSILLGLETSEVDKTLEMIGIQKGSVKVKNFSLGMRQRLAVGMCIMGNPDIILFDEPLNSVDPEGIIDIRNLIKKINEEYGTTIIISSHGLEELSKVANRYGFMRQGKVIKEITKEEIAKSCGSYLSIKVPDANLAAEAIGNKFIFGKVNDTTINIKGDVSVTKVVKILNDAGINIESINTQTIGIENYYIQLMRSYHE